MAWTAPMTAVANAIFTAAQFNTHVRDNFLETAPAKATTAGGYFVTTGTNSISERVTATALVATDQSTSSTTYTDLTTAGPAVTVTTGTRALVAIKAGMWNATLANQCKMSWAVSGASTVAGADARAINTALIGTTASATFRIGSVFLQTGLTAGSNTFTAKYASSAASAAHFLDRDIVVIPL